MFDIIVKRVPPFLFGFAAALFSANLAETYLGESPKSESLSQVRPETLGSAVQKTDVPTGSGISGSGGTGAHCYPWTDATFESSDSEPGHVTPAASRVTSSLKILSKPKAAYTDAARTNSVQGSVRLKVTLLASGAVGSVVPVTRLPHGLTEQAIAAARQVRFEPKKVNGVPVTTVVTFEYGFNNY